MTSSFPPPPDRPEDRKGADPQIQQRASRSASALSRFMILAVTLLLLVGLIALVRTGTTAAPSSSPVNTAAPSRSAAPSPGTQASSAPIPRSASSAPDFTLATLGGGSFHLASQLGHVVVLYFLATGCADCTPGSHDLGQAMTNAAVPGAEALAIDVNGTDQPADLEALVQGAGIPAAAAIDWGIDTTGEIAHLYGVQILETTIVIDTHGQIAYRRNGAVPPAQLAQIVRNLA